LVFSIGQIILRHPDDLQDLKTPVGKSGTSGPVKEPVIPLFHNSRIPDGI
jgi:hypothetical protein